MISQREIGVADEVLPEVLIGRAVAFTGFGDADGEAVSILPTKGVGDTVNCD